MILMPLKKLCKPFGAALVIASSLCVLPGCVTVDAPNSMASNRDPVKAVKNYVALGLRYLQLGDTANASRALQRAYDINPDSPDANEALAMLYTRQNEPKQVEKHYKRALAVKSDFSKARNNYASFLYQQGRYQDAIEQLNIASADVRYTNRYQSFENLGLAYLKLDKPEEARKNFRRAIQLNPALPVSQIEMAALSLNDQDFRGASFYLQQFDRTGGRATAKKLWLEIQVARALGKNDKAASAALALKNLFPKSEEYKTYLQSLGK